MNLDQINEHYYGNLTDPATERARQRIHWICAQANGRDVLDIGCSQGIVCLILGREGFRCTGIDIEAASLRVAEEALAKEDGIIRNRVKFQIADASSLPFGDQSFDTVVLGEILEHLTQPHLVLAEAKRVLRDAGRVILTVPHGLNAFHDHKRAYYPILLLEVLQPHFKTQLIDVQGNYIIYLGAKDPAYDPGRVTKESLFDEYLRLEKAIESRCLEKEQALLDQGTKLYAQIKAMTSQAAATTDRLKQLHDAVAEQEKQNHEIKSNADAVQHGLRAELAAAELALAGAKQQITTLQSETAARKAEATQAVTELADAKAALFTAEESRAILQTELIANAELLARQKTDLDRATDELATAMQRLAGHERQLAEKEAALLGLKTELLNSGQRFALLEQRLVALQRDLASEEQAVIDLNAELAAVHETLAGAEVERQTMRAENSASQAELAQLEAKLKAETAEREKLQKQNAELDTEVRRLTQELNTSCADWQKRLLQTESLHAGRLREREKQLQAELTERAVEVKRARAGQRIRDIVRSVLPANSRVLVISKGDEDLLFLDGRVGWHFPQTSGGTYAGHHPSNSTEAIGLLEALKAKGGEYLLIPASAFWWLDFYADFRCHLEANYRLVTFDRESCVIFSITTAPAEQTSQFELSIRPTASTSAGRAEQPVFASPAESKSTAPPLPVNKATSTPASASTTAMPPQQKPTGTNSLSTSAGSDIPKPTTSRLVVGGVFDEFTAACFRPDCSLVTFRPDNWKSVLQQNPIDLLFVESAWHGNGGSWQYKIASFKKPMGDEIVDVVKYCQGRNIPTVFWNKEDPPHFDRFIHRAPLFDFVFTSDADMIPRYREVLKHHRIFALPFAAQPKIQHPILETPRMHNVCFAGAYYAADHDERRADMDHLLRPALAFGLHIYDRQQGLAGANAKLYQFPDRYQPAIKGRLEYEEMVKAYKWYKVFLNVNSVKTSPTMFSRRVFELLASGTPVISAPAKAIPLVLGGDVVRITGSEQETKAHLELLLGDEPSWSRLSLQGIRAVLSRHTYAHRLSEVCRRIGVKFTPPPLPSIAAVAVVDNAEQVKRLVETLMRQTYRNFDLTVLPGKSLTKSRLNGLTKRLKDNSVRVLDPGNKPVPQLLQSSPDGLVWLLNSDDYYGDEFLHDAALATVYADAEVIGKHTHFEWQAGKSGLLLKQAGHDFRRAAAFSPGSILAWGGKLSAEQWSAIAANRSIILSNLRGLSIDRFNYVRHGGGVERPRGKRAKHPLAPAIV